MADRREGHIHRLRREVHAAEDRLRDAVRASFPEGDYVEVPRGNGFVRGWVLPHLGSNFGDPFRIRLQLESTGREFSFLVSLDYWEPTDD